MLRILYLPRVYDLIFVKHSIQRLSQDPDTLVLLNFLFLLLPIMFKMFQHIIKFDKLLTYFIYCKYLLLVMIVKSIDFSN